jgi:predicted DNA-binding protein (MmcQ/YjbR family)
MRAKTRKSRDPADELRRFALTFPNTHEDHPWGEIALKVAKKVFVFLGDAGGGIRMSVKLKASHLAALELPFCAPTAYGLGKSGWVTVSFDAKASVPVSLLKEWIEESFRSVAPKKLVKAHADGAAARPSTAAGAREKTRRR